MQDEILRIDEEMLTVTGVCPYCGATLDYREDKRAVMCHGCGMAVPTAMVGLKSSACTDAQNDDQRIAEGVVSAQAAMVYADNYCDEYDWAEFAHSEALTLPRLDAISESCRIKFSIDPIAYILDFRRLAIPLMKKIEGLCVLEAEIVNNYKNDDISDVFEYFDLYSNITKLICQKRDDVYASLGTNIKLAKKFGADERAVAELEKSLEVLRAAADGVKPIEKIEDIEAYCKVRATKDAELAAKFREAKIDAAKTYEKAMALLGEGNVDAALHLLLAIRGYRDSIDIIEAHSGNYTFNDELAELAGRRYLIKNTTPVYFDLKNPRADGVCRALYEIVDGVPASAPSVSQITHIIGSFGSKIYFIRNNNSICCFDTLERELYADVRVLDEAPVGDYLVDEAHPVLFSKDGSKFFIRKKIRETKRGCFGKRAPKVNRQNNYSIILVNMDGSTVRTILPEVVDIMDFVGDKIFYTTISENGACFRIFNIESGENDSILNADCVIHNVLNGRIIYSLWSPSEYNVDLYSVDIQTKEAVLIDRNSSGYYTTYDDRVYYTVGQGAASRLYSATLTGEDKREVMENAGRITALRSGWIYYVSGEGQNACLMKTSADGRRCVRVACRFASLVKMTNGIVYFINTRDELCSVRCDGFGERVITSAVKAGEVIVSDGKIYCLRHEFVGNTDGSDDGYGYSLYSVDLDGKNLKKLVHSAVAIGEYDSERIFVCSKKAVDFSVERPISKDRSEYVTTTREIVTYSMLNTSSDSSELIAKLGSPDKVYGSYKRGCAPFRHYEIKEGSITELPRYPRYERANVAPAGQVLREEMEAIEAKKQAKIDAKKAKKQAKIDAKNAAREAKKQKKAEERARKQAKKDAKRAKKEAKLAKKEAKKQKKADKKAKKAEKKQAKAAKRAAKK